MSASFVASRRSFIMSTGISMLTATLQRNAAIAAIAGGAAPAAKVDADQALQMLIDGNKRFDDGKITHPRREPGDFKPLAQGQYPIAAVVSCSDSRVTPEILFDVGIGDLFVIRIAGNYIDGAGAAVKGSIEYAVAELNVPLIMVLGHSQCGAVKAAIEHIHNHDSLPGSINDLVNSIKPAVLEAEGKSGDLLENTIEANVRRGVAKLKTMTPIVEPALKSGKIKVVGATYELATGSVSLLS